MEKEIPASLAFLNIEVIKYPRPELVRKATGSVA
jgi:hypothetical protein